MENNYTVIFSILYGLVVGMVTLWIIFHSNNPNKSLAYLILIVAFPLVGILFYLVFGVNYRRKNFYDYKIQYNKKQLGHIINRIQNDSKKVLEDNPSLQKYTKSILSVLASTHTPVTEDNQVKVLLNGENKFELVKSKLKEAKHHIHLMYYIYEDDTIGNEVSDILIEKKKQGVIVRLLYDDFGSSKIGKIINKMQAVGIEVYPINPLKISIFASRRINHRDHRKIIVIDGEEAFIGGINVGDNYVNVTDNSKKLYWRDTHVYIKGKAVYYLQYLFWSTYCFIRKESYDLSEEYFKFDTNGSGNSIVQVVAGGPDSKELSIEESILAAMYSAKERIYITTPYFIPSESIRIALVTAAHAGVDVMLLAPYKGDSFFVNSASRSYYQELLEAGVKVFLYEKGFIHAKTIVIDNDCSIIGTANMDIRSMELNFEVNVNIFNETVNNDLAISFLDDLEYSQKIELSDWKNRSKLEILIEKIARLFSPVL